MMRNVTIFAVLAVLVGGCADGSTPLPGVDETACGIAVCAIDETDEYDVSNVVVDPEGGKSDAADEMSALLSNLTADGTLDEDDVLALWDEAGNKKSKGELAILGDAIAEETAYEITTEAAARARTLARVANIGNDDEVAVLSDGMSFAGEVVPDEVLAAVAKARFNGAMAYDVTETDDDGELKWTHYPSLSPPVENMAWTYTQVTPAALQTDLDDVDVVYNAIIGSETVVHRTGQEYKRAKYEERTGGTGHVLAHYDEVYHPDIHARGAHGQKWANNVAILSDGTFHCLPAARRDVNQQVILTNPALARGKHLLYNGHLDIQSGEVVGIEMSGRLSKMAAKGKTRFIDPVPLLEAWGFTMSPTLTLRYGNTSEGVPVQRDGIITSAD